MDSDRVKGAAKDMAGKAERKVGEWTNDPKHEVKGAMKQAEGKVQNAIGKAKDEARDLEHEKNKADERELDRELDANDPTRQPRNVNDKDKAA
jgi:uncharacterized protein YjbJ (UPF0337 family)